MFSKEIIEQARAIVAQLHIPEKFGCDQDSEFDSCDLQNQLACLVMGNFHIENGITKAVIIFDNLPYVIKIPFNGTWDYDYDYDEENDEWVERDAIFTYFNCARAFDTSDYCWNELDKIVMAYKRGYGCFFPKTAVIFANGQRFYIQEKVQVACERRFTPTTSKDSRDKAASLTGEYRICNEDWRAAAIESYGEAILISFVNWNDAGMLGYLDDMHNANYGYRFDGTPVMFDVSGFRD